MSDTLLIGDGYIGSAIADAIPCHVIDLRNGVDFGMLTLSDLMYYQTVILMAGHSSVRACLDDPSGAWTNNVTKFQRLLSMIEPWQTFIYASSGSVYNNSSCCSEATTDFHLTNIYDLSKHTIDHLATLSGKNVYGLRFGTVNGPSRRTRNDIVLNKMVHDGLRDGRVSVANPQVVRPILDIKDLVQAVELIRISPWYPGVYNLASFECTVGELAEGVAERLGIPIDLLPDTPAYSFHMDTTRFRTTFGFHFNGTVESIVEDLCQSVNA